MKNKLFLQFVGQFIVYLIIVGCLSAYPIYKYADGTIREGIMANLGLFIGLTILAFWIISRVGTSSGMGMLNAFLLGMTVKMLVSLVYFLLLLKEFKGREIEFAITFFAVYLICTGFEVYFLLRNLRQI